MHFLSTSKRLFEYFMSLNQKLVVASILGQSSTPAPPLIAVSLSRSHKLLNTNSTTNTKVKQAIIRNPHKTFTHCRRSELLGQHGTAQDMSSSKLLFLLLLCFILFDFLDISETLWWWWWQSLYRVHVFFFFILFLLFQYRLFYRLVFYGLCQSWFVPFQPFRLSISTLARRTHTP
jgi:uncharacterized membrane protein